MFNDLPFKKSAPRKPSGWLKLSDVTRNNLTKLDASFPLGVLTSVTGVSGSGKSSLVSQVLVELMATQLGKETSTEEETEDELQKDTVETLGGNITEGAETLKRMVVVNQKPIGRTPRSESCHVHGLV